FGLFDTGGDTFAPHRALGFAMAGIAVLILVLALIARPGARAIAGSAVLVLLTSLVQSLLAGLGKDHAAYGGLHALDGLLTLGVAGYLHAQARRRETEDPRGGRGAAGPARRRRPATRAQPRRPGEQRRRPGERRPGERRRIRWRAGDPLTARHRGRVV